MSGTDSLWAVIALIAVIFVVAAGWNAAAIEGASQTATISDEEAEIRINETVALEADGVLYNVSDVYVPNASDTYTEGVDYEYSEYAGTLTWLNSTNTQTDEGDVAQIDYTAEQQDETTQEYEGLMGYFPFILVLVLFVGIGGWLLDTISGTWGT